MLPNASENHFYTYNSLFTDLFSVKTHFPIIILIVCKYRS